MRCKSCDKVELRNGLSIELGVCRDCRGDYPGGSNYVSKVVLIQSSSELKAYEHLNKLENK